MASHADGSLITGDAPAIASEIIVIACTGLGQTMVPMDGQSDGRLVPLNVDLATIEILRFPDLGITVDGTLLDPRRILWAGLTPVFAGLYQINLQLPDSIGANPEIRVWIGGQGSPSGVKLITQPGSEQLFRPAARLNK